MQNLVTSLFAGLVSKTAETPRKAKIRENLQIPLPKPSNNF